MDQVDLIIQLEKDLLTDIVRNDVTKLNLLISDSFKEIGSTGSIYSKQDLIEKLPGSIIGYVEASGWSAEFLSEGICMVNFKINKDNKTSLRTSIWSLEDESWKLRFHQSTIQA